MSGDFKRPTDQLKSALGEDSSGKAKDNVAKLTDMMEKKEFVPPERVTITEVPIADLPMPEGISGAEDFKSSSSLEALQSGIGKLQEMKPVIDNGVGNNSDYWGDYDAAHGLDVPNGYRIVYDSYYGSNDHIRVDKDGDRYDILNGRHRIWLAKQMGVESLPMEVVDVKRDR